MDYKKAIMKLDQEEVEGSDLDQDEEYQQETVQDKANQSKYMAIISIFIIAFLGLLVFFGITIAASLTPLPKVHMEYHEQAYFPDSKTNKATKIPKVQSSKGYYFDALTREIKISDPSAVNLVQVQSINSAHRRYQQTLRSLEASSAHMLLDQYADQRFSEYSSMTYKSYLQALDSLQLTTFAIDDFSVQRNQLINQERVYYSQKYRDVGTMQNEICVVVGLTRQGLQSQQYYFMIKSIFQQQYSRYRLIVMNHPQSYMLKEVRMLLEQFGSSKVTFVDKNETQKEQQIGSAFYINGIVHKYCKGTELTLLLHDRGELIGKQAFKAINKAYAQHQPSIIFTHYLLEPLSPLRSAPQTFRYKVQLYPLNLSNSRNQPYKTKYLKVYSTQMLLRLDDKAFKRSDGSWISNLFQSNLQFSMMELSCNQYYLLEEILYMASVHDMEAALEVFDARMHEKLKCYLDKQQPKIIPKNTQSIDTPSLPSKKLPQPQKKTLIQLKKQIAPPKQLLPPSNLPKLSQLKFIQYNFTSIISQDQITRLKSRFISIHSQRSNFNQRLYNSETKQINSTMIYLENKESIDSKIGMSHLKKVAQKLNGARASLYIDHLKNNTNSNRIEQPGIKDKSIPIQETAQFIVFLITDNNNDHKLSFLYTIQSVLMQKYSKFQFVIIDNYSDDGTSNIIKYHLSIIPQEEKRKVKFYQTASKAKKSQILYEALNKFSKSNQIVMLLESGQELIHSQVFQTLNQHYKKTNALAVYSNSLYIENEIIRIGISGPPKTNIIKESTYRKHPLYFQKLQTFKSQLFYKINKNDFMDKGQWMNEKEKEVIFYAIEQLACLNIEYLNEILVRLPYKSKPTTGMSQASTKYACAIAKP